MKLKELMIRVGTPLAPLLMLSALCSASSALKPDEHVVDCSKNSAINVSTTTDDLMNIFGASHVLNGRIQVGEGETQPGIMVFPGDPKKRLAITWGERTQPQPMVVRISSENSKWQTAANIGMGRTLKEIEEKNGRPFTITGFGWDYDGTVTSWRGGSLGHSEKGCKIMVRLRPSDSDFLRKKQWTKLRGARDFSSAHPAMQALNPRVYDILILFWDH